MKQLISKTLLMASFLSSWALIGGWNDVGHIRLVINATHEDVIVNSGHADVTIDKQTGMFVDPWKFFVEWCGRDPLRGERPKLTISGKTSKSMVSLCEQDARFVFNGQKDSFVPNLEAKSIEESELNNVKGKQFILYLYNEKNSDVIRAKVMWFEPTGFGGLSPL